MATSVIDNSMQSLAIEQEASVVQPIVEKAKSLVIPSMTQFMTKNLASTEKVLLNNLKSEIDSIIIFLQEHFINDDSDEIIANKLNMLSTSGYEILFRINAYLNILYLKDERICNKQLYEQCLNTNVPIGAFIDTISSLRDYNNDLEINEIFDKAKLIKNLENINNDNITLVNKKIIIKKRNNKLTRINIFNSNINNYILTSYAMKQILSKA